MTKVLALHYEDVGRDGMLRLESALTQLERVPPADLIRVTQRRDGQDVPVADRLDRARERVGDLLNGLLPLVAKETGGRT